MLRRSGLNVLGSPRLIIALVLALPVMADVLPAARALGSSNNVLVGFIENRGQLDEAARYYRPGTRAAVHFTAEAVVFDFRDDTIGAQEAASRGKASPGPSGSNDADGLSSSRGHVLRIRFVDANPNPDIEAQNLLPTRYNYFIGNDPGRWRSDVPAFGEVVYRDLWPGIDLVFHEDRGAIRYEVRAVAGADPRLAEFAYEGAEKVVRLEDGSVQIDTPIGIFTDLQPQDGEWSGSFAWSPSPKTISDPQGSRDETDLTWSTYLGGSNTDYGFGGERDESGNIYVVGATWSSDFPTTSGSYDETYNYGPDVFVSKFDPSGSVLVYSTYLGGTEYDTGYSIAVDDDGCAYVTGFTYSTDFPTTPGAFDRTCIGDRADVFVTKLSSSGSNLVYSTYLGGDIHDWWIGDFGYGIAVDTGHCAYVVGHTDASDFPTTPGAFDRAIGGADAFVTKLNDAGSALEYSTYLGGSNHDVAYGVAIESAYAIVTGDTQSEDFPTTSGAYDQTYNGQEDVFVTRVNLAGSDLGYSSYLGGSLFETGYGVAVDGGGYAYVTGTTNSSDLPTTTGAYDQSFNGSRDAFVAKLDTWGPTLSYSTFLGGSDSDGEASLGAIAVDSQGSAYIASTTRSSDYPTTSGAFDETYNGGDDACLTKLNADGSELLYSTFLGGDVRDNAWDLDIDDAGSAYIMGLTSGGDFPTTSGAYDPTHNGSDDAYVAKLYTAGRGAIAGTVSGAQGPIAGAIVTAAGSVTRADTTDAGGSYLVEELPVGFYDVTATAGGYQAEMESDVLVEKDQTTTVDFLLERESGTIAGTVISARGPIAGAIVTAVGEMTAADTTDAAGEYSLGDLFCGLYDVTASATGYDPITEEDVEVLADQITTVDFALHPGVGAITGMVSEARGPIAGAIVTAQGASTGSDTTDATGTYLIAALRPGTYEVTAAAMGHFRRTEGGVSVIEDETTVLDIALEAYPEHLVWSTYLGGSDDDEPAGIAIDYTGSVFVTGTTWSADFPTTTGAYDESYAAEGDAFVAKLNSETSMPFFITFLGGGNVEEAHDIVVDNAGFIYVTGETKSEDFPTTAGAYDETFNSPGETDVFVTKLQPGGNDLAYSTFLGGTGGEEGEAIAIDDIGHAYVTGSTWSPDFPTTPGAYQQSVSSWYYEGFVTKLNPPGDALFYSTYLGGDQSDLSRGIDVGPDGSAYVIGITESSDFPTTSGTFDPTHGGAWDGFATRLDPVGSALVYSTFLGGVENDEADAIVVDASGHAHVTGFTESSDFPTSIGAYDVTYNGEEDAYALKLDSEGSSLVYGTFIGGESNDGGASIALDEDGVAYLIGDTSSDDFPTTDDAFLATYSGIEDAYLVALGPTGETLSYATFVGGSGEDCGRAVAVADTLVYVTGFTESADFPTQGPFCDPTHNGLLDLFVTKFDLASLASDVADDQDALPSAYGLYGNWPNPFNSCTTIRYDLASPVRLTLSIYDPAGRRARVLVDAAIKPAGRHAAHWDGRNDAGRAVASGIYFYRLHTQAFTETRPMVLFR